MRTPSNTFICRGSGGTWWAVAFVLMSLTQSAWSGPNQIQGAYSATIKGSFSGSGTIAVGASTLSITLAVKNEAGLTGQLVASNLKLVNGRFTGKGTVLGAAMTISGRVDPQDSKGPLAAATIQATFSVDATTGGRIVGIRRSGPN